MKNFGILMLGLIILSGIMVGCSSKNLDNSEESEFIIEEINTDGVLAYNDNLRKISLKCLDAQESMWNVYNEYDGGTTEDVKMAIDDAVSQCKDSMFKINNLGDWEGDSSLKDGVISIIEKIMERYEKLYETLPFLPLLDEGLSEDDATIYKGIKAELDSLDGEITELNGELSDIQYSFAEAHGYELQEED